jgi:hypothetical protein
MVWSVLPQNCSLLTSTPACANIYWMVGGLTLAVRCCTSKALALQLQPSRSRTLHVARWTFAEIVIADVFDLQWRLGDVVGRRMRGRERTATLPDGHTARRPHCQTVTLPDGHSARRPLCYTASSCLLADKGAQAPNEERGKGPKGPQSPPPPLSPCPMRAIDGYHLLSTTLLQITHHHPT